MALSITSAVLSHLYNLLYLSVLFSIMLAVGMRVFSHFKISGLRTLERGLFALALGVGITGYVVYGIGLLHLLNAWVVIILLMAAIFLLGKEFRIISKWLARTPSLIRHYARLIAKNPRVLWVLIPLKLFLLFTFIGAAVPETEFDALWYHLTLPKIYIIDQAIHYVPGSLLYYSVFPRLTEMMYTLGLLVGNDIVAKLFHWSFGVLFLLSIFALARRYFSSRVGLLACLIVVGTFDVIWLSRTAYIDLASAFFGTIVALALLLWATDSHEKKQSQNLLFLLGIFSGLLLATKHWSLAILPTVSFIIFVKDIFVEKENRAKKFFAHLGVFLGISLLVVVPWYIDAYVHTGNPLYPLGSFHSPEDYGTATGAVDWLTRVWPKGIIPFTWQYISSAFAPVLGLIVLIPFLWKKISQPTKYLFAFALVYFLIYSFIPTQYYRYSFGALGVLAILASYVFFEHLKGWKWLSAITTLVIALPLAVNFAMLLKLDKPVLKVFAGLESHDEYLKQSIAQNVFAFYDRDGYFAKNFGSGSKGKVLTYNVHNLFYVNFPFMAYENKPFETSNIHSEKDFVEILMSQDIHYVLFKNSEIQALWENLGKPSDLATFSSIFEQEYSAPEDSIILYKVKE